MVTAAGTAGAQACDISRGTEVQGVGLHVTRKLRGLVKGAGLSNTSTDTTLIGHAMFAQVAPPPRADYPPAACCLGWRKVTGNCRTLNDKLESRNELMTEYAQFRRVKI